MAREKDRLNKNASGPFFVDSSCIDCGSCWKVDPAHFAKSSDSAYVHTQPKSHKEVQKAFLAVIDCPVSAIGAPKALTSDCSSDNFPILVTKTPLGAVYYCGWSSKQSFGASSWLIIREEGNVLIDSPRWSRPLSKQITKMGGIKQILLTHRDDVADHEMWSKEFNCERWIHTEDADVAPKAENQLTGEAVLNLDKNLKLIPTPGHTKGSIVAVLGNRQQILFSGDHLWWNPEKKVLVASKDYCWWSWSEQIQSVKRLLPLNVSWLLPGHGYAKEFKPGEWSKAIKKTIKYLESQ